MDIALLTTTNDIEQLRAMALAMVQKVVDENRQKNTELLAKEQRISLLEEALIRCSFASNASGKNAKH